MTDQTPIQPAAKVLGGLTPYLQLDGAFKAAEFYKKAFGAEQVFFYPPDEQGRTMHIHLHINGSTLMISDFYPENGMPAVKPQGYTMQLHLGADEIDALVEARRRCRLRSRRAAPADVLGRPVGQHARSLRRRMGDERAGEERLSNRQWRSPSPADAGEVRF